MQAPGAKLLDDPSQYPRLEAYVKDIVGTFGKDRSPRIQQFTWRPDGTPDFGVPVRTGVPLRAPSATSKGS